MWFYHDSGSTTPESEELTCLGYPGARYGFPLVGAKSLQSRLPRWLDTSATVAG